MVLAAPHSPPRLKPCKVLAMTRNSKFEGEISIRLVDKIIITADRMIECLLPILSPIYPNNILPDTLPIKPRV